MNNLEEMKIPWNVEQTIENLKIIKIHYQDVVRKANRDGMGEQDAMEVAFDFDRAISALENQEENMSCTYNLGAVMEQLDGAVVTRFEGKLKDGRICHYEDIKYIVRTGGKLPQ